MGYNKGFGSAFGPKFFRSFQTAIELLDRRFHMAAGDWQAQATVFIVVHSRLLVFQVP